MRTTHFIQTVIVTLTFASCIAVLPNTCFAKKGGNGGGKPGGGGEDPPNLPDIRYGVTPVQPGGIYFDHNNDAATVGFRFFDNIGRRAYAYLPGISETQAFYLDDPILGITGIPSEWHSRTAVDINNHNTLVGNIEPDLEGSENATPFVIRDIYSSTPVLEQLDPFDPQALREVVMVINDGGDMVIQSERGPRSDTVAKLFLGSLQSYDSGGATSFLEIDFAAQGIQNPQIDAYNFGHVKLSERIGTGPAFLAGDVRDGESEWIFRTTMDGSPVEMLQAGSELFSDSEGTHRLSSSSNAWDLTDTGDVIISVLMESSKGKGKNRTYPAIWKADGSTFVPVPGAEEVDARYAFTNESGDYLLDVGSGANYLWHSDWSPDNGPIAIADLIDPNDPNATLSLPGFRELTERDDSGWPTLIGNSSSNFVVLRPTMIANAATTAVPEPHALALMALAALVGLSSQRISRRSRQ